MSDHTIAIMFGVIMGMLLVFGGIPLTGYIIGLF